MIVIYAEKADVGNKIAAALGGFDLGGTHIDFKNRQKHESAIKKLQREQGYLDIIFKGKPCKVTWGYGHLYALQDVPEYNPDFKSWAKRPLCFIPETFQLHPTTSTLANFKKSLDKQRSVVKRLFAKADYVINATDYDREGELIFAYVCEAVKYSKPFYRVLFTSQTEEGINEAFDNLIPSSKVKQIEYAGRARSIYDWCIGTNLSTRMTLRFPGNDILSIGRVQTPVLKMLVDREEAIRNFVPTFSWNIKATFTVGQEEYNGLYKGNGTLSKTDADSILDEIKGMPGVVSAIDKRIVRKELPLLYSQTSLQIDASKYFGYTAKETLAAAQYLYENGYTSYPRTKSQYLTDDMEKDVIKTLTTLSSTPEYGHFLTGRKIQPNKKIFNSSKVISHFAIIPTGHIPSGLSGANADIYNLIVWSLIRTIYPDAILEKVSVTTTVNGKYDFKSSGSTIIESGWLAVNVTTKEKFLPPLIQGEAYKGVYEGREVKTEPPQRYDDGSLVKAMKTAGKDLDDENFKAILANPDVEGIGTDATRAEIIETLINRQYIYRKGKVFYVTDKGMNLIHTIPVPDMMSAEFTAKMEQKLAQVENGTLDYNILLQQIFQQTEEWCKIVAAYTGASALSSSTSSKPKGENNKMTGIKCPHCDSEMKAGTKAWNCSNENCDFHIFRNLLSHSLTDTEIKKLLTGKTVGPIKNFVSKKTGNKFEAKIRYNDEEKKIDFVFD